LIVGTLNAIPVNFPLISGMTNPTAFAAPVDDGMMLADAALPALQSLPPFDGPSTTNYVAVEACTVVIRPKMKLLIFIPSTIPKLSFTTLATGAKQFVVHEAFETTC
jgi:hypothetical protein